MRTSNFDVVIFENNNSFEILEHKTFKRKTAVFDIHINRQILCIIKLWKLTHIDVQKLKGV